MSGAALAARLRARFAAAWRGRAPVSLLLAAAGAAHLLYHAGYTLDDAYITFRYARNLVRGVGLVFNPGDYVKGYSNTLYTLLMVIPEMFGRDPVYFAKALGLLSFGALCLLAHRFYAADERAEVRDRGPLAIAFMAVSAPLAVHSISGLETGLHTALLFAGVLARLHEQTRDGARPWSALLFSALVLSRPEGIALFGAMAVHDLGVRIAQRRFDRRDALFYALPVLTFAAELGWSQLYYGDPLPQTYHAKGRPLGGSSGAWGSLVHGLLQQTRPNSDLMEGLALTWSPAVSLLVPLALLRRERRRANAAFALAVLAQLFFMTRSLHDWAPAFRFGVPMLPPLFMLVLESIGVLVAALPKARRAAGLSLGALACALLVPANLKASRDVHAAGYVNAASKLVEGRLLASLAQPGITLASFDIGGIGYAAGGFDVLDGAGLTVRAMTRCLDRKTKRCKRYSALTQPELVRVHPSGADRAYIVEPVTRAGRYLSLSQGRYLIRASEVLSTVLPEDAEPVSAPGLDLAVMGTDLARVVPAGGRVDFTLYWRRGNAGALPKRRALIWSSAERDETAIAGPPLWTKLTAPGGWSAPELFADRIATRAPRRPGRYAVRVKLGAIEQAVASVEIVDERAAPSRARTLLGQADRLTRAGKPLAAVRLHLNALRLDPRGAIRDAYQLAVVRRATQLRRDAQKLAGGAQSRLAIALLHDAKRLLHGAYWNSGHAGRALRNEIDANGKLWSSLVESELDRMTDATDPRGPQRKARRKR